MWPFVCGFFYLTQCFQGSRQHIYQYFLFMTKQYSIVWIDHLFIHLLADRHFKCLLLILYFSSSVIPNRGIQFYPGKAYKNCQSLATIHLGSYNPPGGRRACSLNEDTKMAK